MWKHEEKHIDKNQIKKNEMKHWNTDMEINGRGLCSIRKIKLLHNLFGIDAVVNANRNKNKRKQNRICHWAKIKNKIWKSNK